MWVADDSTDDKLYAYTLAGGARDTDKEFNLHSDNVVPLGHLVGRDDDLGRGCY